MGFLVFFMFMKDLASSTVLHVDEQLACHLGK